MASVIVIGGADMACAGIGSEHCHYYLDLLFLKWLVLKEKGPAMHSQGQHRTHVGWKGGWWDGGWLAGWDGWMGLLAGMAGGMDGWAGKLVGMTVVTILLLHVLDAYFLFYLHAFTWPFSFLFQHADIAELSYMLYLCIVTYVYHALGMRTLNI